MNTKPQSGFSMVEIMIGLALSLVLLAGILQLFIGTKKSYEVQEELSRMQENGRFGIEFINNNLRSAGYLGCSNALQITPDIQFAGMPVDLQSLGNSFTADEVLDGVDGGGTAADTITVRRAGDCGTSLTTAMAAEADTLSLAANNCGFKTNDVLIVSDCSKADIFTAKAGTTATSIVHDTFNAGKTYGTDAQVFKFLVTTYCIANKPDCTQGTTLTYGPLALLKKVKDGSVATLDSTELVPGIQNMQVLYGEDTDSPPDQTPNRYVMITASQPDIAKVVSVKIVLTAASVASNLDVGNNNGVLTRDFTTITTLRNKPVAP